MSWLIDSLRIKDYSMSIICTCIKTLNNRGDSPHIPGRTDEKAVTVRLRILCIVNFMFAQRLREKVEKRKGRHDEGGRKRQRAQ